MPYVLDSNAFRAVVRGEAAMLQHLRRLPDSEIFLSVIAVREAIRGVMDVIGASEKKGAKGLPQSYTYLIDLLESFEHFQILPYTDEADQLYRSWTGRGVGPGQNDWRIAASAVAANMIVGTADKGFAKIHHFVPELKYEDWSIAE